MSDQRLRELERRWRETGSVEDEAAYLRERVRVGDLTQERLELAAYCGHEGAKRSVNLSGVPLLNFLDWTLGLGRWGETATTFAALTLAEAVLPFVPGDQVASCLGAIAAKRSLISSPCHSSHGQLSEAMTSLRPGLHQGIAAVYLACQCPEVPRDVDPQGGGACLRSTAQAAARVVDQEHLRGRVAKLLQEWALGNP